MPLSIAKLTGTGGLPGAKDAPYPQTRAACAEAWALAMGAYAAGLIPASVTVSSATAALADAIEQAFRIGAESERDSALSAMSDALELALTAFATTLAGGMAAAGYVGTPPPGRVGFRVLFSSASRPASRAEGVQRVAAAIDLWMRTGTAALLSPPGSPPILWS